jgi:ketosteroid isomerase-like protein
MLMKTMILAGVAFAGIAVASPSLAASDPQISATIHQFIDAFDKGDIKAAAATHLSTGVTIIDEVAPHLWQGPNAFMNWAGDLTKDDKAAGISGEAVTLGVVKREVVSGDNAYVIVEAVYSFKQGGKSLREPSQMTYAMKKTAQGWKIAAWAWTGPAPTPAK